ncbi:hypothetical protein HanIR_Chr11g0510431 [Helianthus annuus]|nr:hypothetical protein HanIR_Chr11g0510431 [Helianthus annuus]
MVHTSKIQTQLMISLISPPTPPSKSRLIPVLIAYNVYTPLGFNVNYLINLFGFNVHHTVVHTSGVFPLTLVQPAFPKVNRASPRSTDRVNRTTKRRINRHPHCYIPVIIIKETKLLSFSMYFPPNRSVKRVAHVTHSFRYQTIPVFASGFDVTWSEICSVTIGTLFGFQLR